MSDEIYLGNKTYVSSKRAAKACGYAQDYVGQLARAGVIDAQRVGGLWYVSMESLEAYRRNAEAYTPTQPTAQSAPRELDTIVTFDGKDYVSAARAAKLTGYNPDYVGQLARGGKVLSRQVGNRWYVERDGLLAHKSQKDSLLAAVQAESAGLQRPLSHADAPKALETHASSPYLTYTREDHSLLPVLTKPTPMPLKEDADTDLHPVPIRVVSPAIVSRTRARMNSASSKRTQPSGITMTKAIKSVAVLTVVIVVSYGFTTIKSDSIYAFLTPSSKNTTSLMDGTMAAAASEALDRLADALEQLVSSEMIYTRSK